MEVRLNCITKPLLDEDVGEMSVEEYMVYCARVSSSAREAHNTAPKLLKYLMREGHWSPLEMVSIGIEIKTSRAIAAQLLRHRSFSFQELSQRYIEVGELEPVNLRMKGSTNRQSSTADVEDKELIGIAKEAVDMSQKAYYKLVEAGVATECARMVLPLTTQTTVIMHGTLRSWVHFFEQRCSDHAQLEIQELAYEARRLIGEVCPWTAEALNWNGGLDAK